MSFSDIQQSVDAKVEQSLAAAGFQHTGPGTWNRRRGEELNVVQAQKNSTDETFCVNLGIHYTFLPKAGIESPLIGDSIELPDCELKLRLTSRAAANDQWWPIAAQSAQEVAALLVGRGMSIFDSYRFPGPISEMGGKRIESGDLGLLASLTKVRACLLLARMHEHLGNRDQCIEAATIGIKLAGMAVGPKKALKDILKRCDHG